MFLRFRCCLPCYSSLVIVQTCFCKEKQVFTCSPCICLCICMRTRCVHNQANKPTFERYIANGVSTGVAQNRLLPRLVKRADDDQAAEFVSNFSAEAAIIYGNSSYAAWDYQTNITDYNQEAMNQQSLKASEFTLEYGKKAKEYDIDSLTDASVKRQLESIQILGTANLNSEQQQQYNKITSDMESHYSQTTIDLPGVGNELPLDPDLTEIMATSRDYNLLKAAWKGWFESAGRPIKDDYAQFVELSNIASQMDGFSNTGEYWRSWYEMDGELEATTERLWIELQPLYIQLHAYVRRKLYEKYGPDYINLKGPIPAHLLGNMWAQQWNNIFDLVEPYPGKGGVDATPQMIEQGYDAMRMFNVSEEFFTSLGLEAMTETFWNESMLVRPDDGRQVTCHASAWDFYDDEDFRIKMCTKVNMEDLITVHHEMGHIQYFQQYKHLPVPFRGGANPGFHEAVGDTLALSVSTPKHLSKIGLLGDVIEDDQADINYLLRQAMEKIAFLPFGYLIDKWRWRVFDGGIPKEDYQENWDKLRLEYQGIIPPVERDNSLDFDPGAKYHIPANTPYIRYFVSFVIQFQFYKAMCDTAGDPGPLYKCDFYKSEVAGSKLAEMLKLGSSLPWPDAMEKLTGSREMSSDALMEYFRPVTDWLTEQNKANGDVPGWTDQDWKPRGYRNPESVTEFLESYNSSAEVEFFKSVEAEWEYNTNIRQETQDNAAEQSRNLAMFQASQAEIAKQYDPAEIADATQSRLIIKISDVGKGALDDGELKNLSGVNSNMQTTYSTAKACNVEGESECIPLDPDLTNIMAESRDYNKLRSAWKEWRDVSGKLMRDDYVTYSDLNNKVATLNGFPDNGAYWRSAYETPDIEEQLEAVWQEMLPLYQQLHAYARRKLYNYYGEEVINLKGPIPAHLLGNMWAQDWVNVYDLLEPYSGYSRPDATQGMLDQGWDVMKMFRVADDFFGDMGLIRAPEEFWSETMYVRPEDRDVVCHASAWDFYNRKDFRVKMCTQINQNDFITVHHELGHIQYYLQYKHQPVTFRDGANPGFHEAVGDTLALSVGTLDHLYKLGLIEEPANDDKSDINYLMSVALDKIAFIPFGYLMDKWRWDVFSGRINSKNLNQEWWNYRLKYQGVAPPLGRTEMDFDAGAKFHIPNDVPYIRYFVSVILQFQFYEALCAESNHQDDLFKCDFNGTLEAGEKFGAMLELGSSLQWEDALEQITGTREMSSSSLIKYFQPLLAFLEDENKKNNEEIGWSDYSWQPPTDTYQDADGKVYTGSGQTLSATLSLVLVSMLAVLKIIVE